MRTKKNTPVYIDDRSKKAFVFVTSPFFPHRPNRERAEKTRFPPQSGTKEGNKGREMRERERDGKAIQGEYDDGRREREGERETTRDNEEEVEVERRKTETRRKRRKRRREHQKKRRRTWRKTDGERRARGEDEVV